jgi:hypothetical protein
VRARSGRKSAASGESSRCGGANSVSVAGYSSGKRSASKRDKPKGVDFLSPKNNA